MTAPGWRATALGAVGACLLISWLVIAPLLADPQDLSQWAAVLGMVPCLAVSVLLTLHLPGAAISRVITIFTLCLLLSMVIDAVARLNSDATGMPHPQITGAVGVLSSVLWVGTLPLIAVLLVVFPDGVPPTGWWRRAFIGQMIAVAVAVPVLADQADGTQVVVLNVLGSVAGVFLLVTGAARAVWLVALWWRLKGNARRQVFAFVFMAGALAVFYAVGVVSYLITGDTEIGGGQVQTLVLALLLAGLPAAIGLSVLRHRLYGIEITVNRLAVATFLSVLLFGIYALTAAVVSAIAGGQGVQWQPLLAAGVTVAALGPVYRLARSTVDRMMYGDRERPDRALRTLASNLGETLDPLEVPQTVVNAVADTLRLPFVALDRITPTGRVRAAAAGSPTHDDVISVFPIAFGGQVQAEMLVAPRVGQESLNATDQSLLADLALQAGPALYAGRLVDELVESRERLRLGRLEERATLRRALHDGISPTLAGIAIAAAAARVRDPTDPAVQRLLMRIEEEAGNGSITLRALLAGLRAPGLSELGLAAAIEQRANELGSAAGIHFDIQNQEPLPALDPEVEQTAYLVTVEAMVNVARHAGAHTCKIVMAGHDDSLSVEVVDDGSGLPGEQRDGEGLCSARERVAAAGGTLSFANNDHGGSRLVATLPKWAAP